ncbi:TatD family nuclease-associated radical SAM protein [bacterium 210820-DFI.6.37]|nr:TatD family nuclease-associated radical SAM protein [bacterium 210820-DFI.6.37]
MSSSIVYTYGSGLYINMTNRCTNKCAFCVRQMTDGLGNADSLWLEKEPSTEEVIDELKKWPVEDYEEVIFCGYGEPTIRLSEVLEVSRYLKENTKVKVRVNTNGQADLIHGKRTAPMLEGLVDRVSISLNEADPVAYQALCQSQFGMEAYEAILNYIEDVKRYVSHVAVSVVGCVPEASVEKCGKIAEAFSVEFKVR